MPTVFRKKGKHNSIARRLLLVAIVISTLVALPMSPLRETVNAQTTPPDCNPTYRFIFPYAYYELLNDSGFEGENQGCVNKWVFPAGYQTISSSTCNPMPVIPRFSKIAVLPYASGFYQKFSVPEEVDLLDVSIIFAIVGNPTSNDRIVLELREGNSLKAAIRIRTDLGRYECHREDFTFSGSLVGGHFGDKNLKLRVTSAIVTPGVEFHIDSVQIFSQPLN